MEYVVVAEIEIDGSKIEHYTNITLRQKFNAHHEFIIRISHDVLETKGAFSLEDARKKIGKSVVISLQKVAEFVEAAYEFRGIVCEVRFEQSRQSDADLVLVGYSPTIVIDNGENLASYYKADLSKILKQVTKPLGDVNCTVKINPQYSKQLTYICQYKESGFHFLNRLSHDFSEFFYYDGKDLHFGKPSSQKEIEIIYGKDVSSMQLTLQAQPMNFSNYAYVSKEDKVENYDAPSNVNGLGPHSSYVLKESDKLFSEKVNMPARQRIEKKADLEYFVKKQKASLAAGLEVLTGTSHNPKISIGNIINVKVSRLENNSFKQEDYGKFLVTSIEHHLDENANYYNSFEAIPSSVEVIPVNNVIEPIAEPQMAIVKDNKDPENMGRIRVQMLWQQKTNQMTDWVRVLTSDAGTSDEVSKNRGFVFIPEVGDQVLVCFRYNDADRPFVLGSIFHGKSGGGGGPDNNKKTLSSRSGHIIELNDEEGAESITVKDKNNNIIAIDTPKGKITVQDKNGNHVVIDSVKDSIDISAKNSITLSAMNINLTAGATVNVKATAGYTLTTMNSLSNVLMSTVFNTKNLSQTVLQTLNSNATTINQIAKKDINQKAKEKITISAKNKLDQRAGEMDVATSKGKLKLKASSEVEIKGTTVKTN
jgi:type VI secretion system secreted protein VgrG